VLEISGTGNMWTYSSTDRAPWFLNIGDITSVKIDKGVTSIGAYAFYACSEITSITIPDSVTSIGSMAIYGCDNLTTIYGHAGSYAETYANNNVISFVEIVTFGDIDGDGVSDPADVTKLARYLANWSGYENLAVNTDNADVNLDGKINLIDLIIISRHVAGWSGYENLPHN
jgi:hypothetical protein